MRFIVRTDGGADVAGDGFLVVEEIPVLLDLVVVQGRGGGFGAGGKGVDGLGLAAADAAFDEVLVFVRVVVVLDFAGEVTAP